MSRQGTFPLAPLVELCDRISSGGTPSRKRHDYFTDGNGHPWVKSQELLDRSIFETAEHISDLGLVNSPAKYYPQGTVLIAMYGANRGQLGYLQTRATVNQAICGLCVHQASADSRYVFYALMHERGRLIGQAAGAYQQNLNLDLIRNFQIPLPSIQTQQKIAAILTAYDYLIENSDRRIKLVEEMAQRIYREWFVDFRYPGHENVPLVDSELGPIPQRWIVRKLGEVVSQVGTMVDPGLFPDELFEHFSIPAFDDGRQSRLELGSTIRSNKFLVERPCVMYSKLNPRIPRVWMARPRSDARAVSSTELLVLSARGDWNLPLIYSLLLSEGFADQVTGMAGGTSNSHQRVRPSDLLAIRLADPGKGLCHEFELITANALDLADQLRTSRSLLRRIRDYLLPHLVSGEIDVSDLEIDISSLVA